MSSFGDFLSKDIIDTLIEDDTERVIFLVMSALRAGEVETYCYGDDNDYVFKGISSMEPGTKYFLQKLAKSKKSINRIVVIASKKARGYEDDEEERETDYQEGSAVDVYIKRISEYIRNGRSESLYGRNEKNDREEAQFLGCDLYRDDFVNKNVYVIKEKGTIERIWKAKEAIQPNNEKRIELYFDMQGGDRNDIPMFNSIIEILENNNVSVAERVAIDFYIKNTLQPMKNVDEQYRAYDLSTAYQIFKLYGWGNQLAEFFNEGKTKGIAESVRYISDAIKLCDVEGFDAGLKKLKYALSEWDKDTNREKNEMDFIIGLIKDDYGELFEDVEKKTAPMKYIRQIRWCMKKSFIQQAITIFESKLPTEFVWNGMFYYCKEESKRAELLNKFLVIYDYYDNNKSDKKNRLVDLNHYWVCDYERDRSQNASDIPSISVYTTPKDRELLKRYKEMVKTRNTINHAATDIHDANGFYTYVINNRGNDAFPQNKEFNERDFNKYIDDFEKRAKEISEAEKNKVVDLA